MWFELLNLSLHFLPTQFADLKWQQKLSQSVSFPQANLQSSIYQIINFGKCKDRSSFPCKRLKFNILTKAVYKSRGVMFWMSGSLVLSPSEAWQGAKLSA